MAEFITDIGKSIKAINFADFGGFEAFLAQTSNGGGTTSQQLRRVVPWLAKATDMTALGVSELPFDLLKENGDIFDRSTDWQDKIGGMPTPSDLFYKLAASLCMGAAYVIPKYTGRMIVDLQYCAPQTIQPNITTEGVMDFQRTTQQGMSGKYYPYTAEKEPQLMYFWLPDSDVELGPALATPASSALLSAEMLVSMDTTIRTIAGRGFISPTVLMAKGMNSKDDRAVAETWWNRFIRGWTESVAKILNGDAMTALKIGSGMDELRGIYPELSKQAIENIGTSYGIPAALFMSDMAFASEVDPLIKVWYSTSQFVKIYRCIETTFNTQLLNRWKLKLKFKPETLDAFQENETERAANYRTYTQAGIKPSIAAQMVGMELPEGVEYEDLDPVEEPEPTPSQSTTPATQSHTAEEIPITAPMVKDLGLWQQVALRRFAKGQGCAVDWESKVLPDAITDTIRGRLRLAGTEQEVVKSFEIGAFRVDPVLNALNEANDLMRRIIKE